MAVTPHAICDSMIYATHAHVEYALSCLFTTLNQAVQSISLSFFMIVHCVVMPKIIMLHDAILWKFE